MRVSITIEQRYFRTPDGSFWTPAAHAYSFWTRYLEVFDCVSVIARVQDVSEVLAGWMRADGLGVSFAPVPYYVGPFEYLRIARSVSRSVVGAVSRHDAVIMRVSSQLANCLTPALHASGRPYGLEVVGDPYDVFAPGSVRHPLRPLLRWWFPLQLRRQCSRAVGVAYVTEFSLQRRYPCHGGMALGMSDVELGEDAFCQKGGAFTTHYSSIELSEKDAVQNGRLVPLGSKPFRLLTIGSLEQLYKGTDILIRAFSLCLKQKPSITLTIVGDGKHRLELEFLCKSLGVSSAVRFTGQLPAGPAVRQELDQCDLFVFPSRTEGLPRALVEAMARAVPCIASAVGGIPELLPADDLVPVGDHRFLAAKLLEILDDPRRMMSMSERNVDKAKEYRREVLISRQREFFSHIRGVTERWSDSLAKRA